MNKDLVLLLCKVSGEHTARYGILGVSFSPCGQEGKAQNKRKSSLQRGVDPAPVQRAIVSGLQLVRQQGANSPSET